MVEHQKKKEKKTTTFLIKHYSEKNSTKLKNASKKMRITQNQMKSNDGTWASLGKKTPPPGRP